MKITNVRPLVMGTPWRNLTFVVVETDEGLTGLGEVRMINNTDALLGYLAEAAPRYAIGKDPFDREMIVDNMRRHDYSRAGEVAMSGIALIEMACWDIVGKALNQPVYRLMGGAVRQKVKAYANGWYTVERTPEEFAKAAKKVVAKGYKAAKLDPFGSGFYELERDEKLKSIALVEAVRDAVGPDFDIFVEMHGRFNPNTAIQMAKDLEKFNPGWLEEPTPPENLKALKKVADATTLPIATGERIHTRWECRELFEYQCCDIVQCDLSHFGGISELRKLGAWAESYYMLMAPHNVCGPVATMANVHLAATMPNFKIQEHFNDFADAWVKGAVDNYPEVVDGYFSLPDRPGLGLELNEEFVKAHPRENVHFNLFAEDWHKRQKASTDVSAGGLDVHSVK